MNFLLAILIGLGVGLVIFPILLWFFVLIKNTIMRRKIKTMIKKGKFLIPIDIKDYDSKAWQGKKYGNINPVEQEEKLKNLDNQIFKRESYLTNKKSEEDKLDLGVSNGI